VEAASPPQMRRSILAFVAVGLIAQVLCAGRAADTSRGRPALLWGAGRWARCVRQARARGDGARASRRVMRETGRYPARRGCGADRV
jgi:hypothetical protein